jgi:YbbR domain-containing protein
VNVLARLAENWPLKLVALGLATLAWLVAQGEQVFQSTVVAPVEYVLPEDLVLVNDEPPPEQVVIRASGSRSALKQLQQDLREVSVRFVVDLADAEPGRTVHSFRSLPNGVGGGVTIDTISPAEVELAFDEITVRTVPVLLRTRGSLPAGFVETGRAVDPEEITLTGARSELLDLDVLQTVPLRLGKLRESYAGPLALDLSELHLTDDNPTSVHVDLGVEEAVAEREFGAVPVQLAEALQLQEAVVSPGQSLVRLRGPVPVLETLSRERGVLAVVDGDVSALVWTEDAAVVAFASDAGGPEAAPGVRVRIGHERASELEVLGIEPGSFELTRPPPEPPAEDLGDDTTEPVGDDTTEPEDEEE